MLKEMLSSGVTLMTAIMQLSFQLPPASSQIIARRFNKPKHWWGDEAYSILPQRLAYFKIRLRQTRKHWADELRWVDAYSSSINTVSTAILPMREPTATSCLGGPHSAGVRGGGFSQIPHPHPQPHATPLAGIYWQLKNDVRAVLYETD